METFLIINNDCEYYQFVDNTNQNCNNEAEYGFIHPINGRLIYICEQHEPLIRIEY